MTLLAEPYCITPLHEVLGIVFVYGLRPAYIWEPNKATYGREARYVSVSSTFWDPRPRECMNMETSFSHLWNDEARKISNGYRKFSEHTLKNVIRVDIFLSLCHVMQQKILLSTESNFPTSPLSCISFLHGTINTSVSVVKTMWL